jgi:hypothetical protein
MFSDGSYVKIERRPPPVLLGNEHGLAVMLGRSGKPEKIGR